MNRDAETSVELLDLRQRVEALEKEREELAKNAERYLWIRKTGGLHKDINFIEEWLNDYMAPDKELDEAIDKAINQPT